jgi:hypothetical protein
MMTALQKWKRKHVDKPFQAAIDRVPYDYADQCARCDGAGYLDDEWEIRCPACGGNGLVRLDKTIEQLLADRRQALRNAGLDPDAFSEAKLLGREW